MSEKKTEVDALSKFSAMIVRHQKELSTLIKDLSEPVVTMDPWDTHSGRWAANEVALACDRERYPDSASDEWDYGVECYEAAIRAYNTLLGHGISGFGIESIKTILIRLIDGLPLTPLTGEDSEWKDMSEYGLPDGVSALYQNVRCSSVFKKVYSDGDVIVYNVDNHYCVDIAEPGETYTTKLVSDIINELYPVTFPYFPGSPFKVICRTTEGKTVETSAEAVLHISFPDGTKRAINRYYQPSESGYTRITWAQWAAIQMMNDPVPELIDSVIASEMECPPPVTNEALAKMNFSSSEVPPTDEWGQLVSLCRICNDPRHRVTDTQILRTLVGMGVLSIWGLLRLTSDEIRKTKGVGIRRFLIITEMQTRAKADAEKTL